MLSDVFEVILDALALHFRTIELNVNIYVGPSFSECLFCYTTPKLFCLNGTERVWNFSII